ncbi:23S rRNA (adenine(2503)-C(2))-methyltransferase RlmN [Candidatus Nitronereus thalassa]|uniref:Probable dual-specificity RNA methyltransferase RlmN n=1 Tax=Candidatus Nitronereus thalassa TaxID=3020898 RepID=A0ABU3KA23_9BACT|nr:23S rRNA (adenine(2503)-C(2))-methyltransferase RlmN [Candidatus Nitronereus thalassa]MDT7043248.1 23S rRNA (adenine(2503)-C(2))-methyltransferase RlmN [Candidatus Nitronereus thalassa]
MKPSQNLPMMENSRLNLLAMNAQEIEALVGKFGWPFFKTKQILQWVYQHRTRAIESMSNLSKKDRHQLQAVADIGRAPIPTVTESWDGTRKLLFSLENGLMIESVLIPESTRLTLCISTQVGCTVDCGFCLTGQMGLKRNLKAHEIVDQVMTAQDLLHDGQRITSLVFMGMGEPLANIEAVTEAVSRITNTQWGLGIPPRRITISTAGLAPRLQSMAGLGVNLAISLNATTNKQRDYLMPMVNKLHPLPELLQACRNYPLDPGRRLTFEYVLLRGENDSPEDANRLIQLLRGIRCKINLIPFNEFPGSAFRRPSDAAIQEFQNILRHAHYDVFLRKSRGRDILGACGQLGNLLHEVASPIIRQGVI